MRDDELPEQAERSLFDPHAPWRLEPASEAQLRKLRFYGHRPRRGLTKGEASELIDDLMERCPEKEEEYQRWKQFEDDIACCQEAVLTSDYYEGGEMKKPTRQMIEETIAFLEATRPNWRDENLDRNDFATLFMDRYPELERR